MRAVVETRWNRMVRRVELDVGRAACRSGWAVIYGLTVPGETGRGPNNPRGGGARGARTLG